MRNLTLLEVIKSPKDQVTSVRQFVNVIAPQSSYLSFYTQSNGYVMQENINDETFVCKTKKGVVV
jgi:hypothetical protein